MTSSRGLDREREDLEGLFADVVVDAFEEQAEVLGTGSEPDAGVAGGAAALVALHDESDDTYLGVHVRVSPELARLLATRLLGSTDPAREDLLDAVGRFAGLAADRVRALLVSGARLSLPSATLDDVGLPPAREGSAAPTVLRALVLGQVAELALVPHVEGGSLAWPPSVASGLLEPQA
jgi:hypothetical protein